MSEVATVESPVAIATPVEGAWMGLVPDERPVVEKPVKVEVVEPVAVEAGDAAASPVEAGNTPAAQPSSEPVETARDDAGKFTSKARQEMLKRIDKLTARNKELEAKTAQPAPEPAKATEPAPITEDGYTVPQPAWKDYEQKEGGYDDFIADKAAWSIERKAWVASQQHAQAHKSMASYSKRVDAFKSDHPDFESVMKESPIADVNVGPTLHRIVTGDDNGPEIGYYLSQHADEALDLIAVYGDLPPTERNLDIVRRKLALRLTSVSRGSEVTPPVRQTEAPPPAGRLGASTRTTTPRAIDLAAAGSEDFDASGYAARRREELKRR